jgi:hypothetical protein
MTVTIEPKRDLSGGIQSATTWLLRKPNELEDAYNVRFNKYLGAVSRINGYVKEGSAMAKVVRSQGLHEAKYSNGAKTFVAINNDPTTPTATLLQWYQKSLGNTWTTLAGTTIDKDTLIDMNDSLGEMYVAGKSTTTGNRMQIINVKNDLSVSTTRNLYGAPKATAIVEYQGALYAINVDINGVVYSDRAYRSSQALGAITFVQGYQAFATTNITTKLDSVQYIKPGMVLDIYKAGTETKTYDSLAVISVDKNLKTMTFAAQTTSSNNASANTTTDQLLVTSSTLFPTGQPVQLSGGTLPTGISAGVTYYAINIDSTHIQLATSYSNAIANPSVPIDITATGAGTATVYQGMSDNDELWGHARKNELAYYWNLDYPTTDQADFLRIIPGIAADSEILAYAKSNNRLFFFTKTATFKWDNANLVPIFEDIGCINQQTIQNIGDWLIWVDADGQIHARNDSTGQHEIISRGIRNKWLENVPQSSFITAGSGRSKNIYKINVGAITVGNVTQIWRFCYDFDSNNWSREIVTKNMYNHLYSDMSGNMRLYFTDASGQMWLDEEGNTHDTVTIPFYIKLGRDNGGTDYTKDIQGFYIFGQNTPGASVKLIIEDGDPMDIGQLRGKISTIKVPANVKSVGRDYSVEITQNSEGDPISIEGVSPFFDVNQDKFDG